MEEDYNINLIFVITKLLTFSVGYNIKFESKIQGLRFRMVFYG
jgi:hypothetical protein